MYEREPHLWGQMSSRYQTASTYWTWQMLTFERTTMYVRLFGFVMVAFAFFPGSLSGNESLQASDESEGTEIRLSLERTNEVTEFTVDEVNEFGSSQSLEKGYETLLQVLVGSAKELKIESDKIESLEKAVSTIHERYSESSLIPLILGEIGDTLKLEYETWGRVSESSYTESIVKENIESRSLPLTVEDFVPTTPNSCEKEVIQEAKEYFRSSHESLISKIVDISEQEQEELELQRTLVNITIAMTEESGDLLELLEKKFSCRESESTILEQEEEIPSSE